MRWDGHIRPTITCPVCGTAFFVKAAELDRRRFCSQTCKAAHMRARATLSERFWAKVDKSEGCWLWKGGVSKGGYGLIWHEGDNRLAHRVAYELEHGPIESESNVCHRCDTPRCVRPDHLFLGSQTDNSRDMVAKGRQARGAKFPRAVLTDEMVRSIRRDLAAGGLSQRKLAARYAIDPSVISDIHRGKAWKHVT